MRNVAALVLKVGGWLLMLALLWTFTPNVTRAVNVASDETVLCGGVFGLRDFGGWRDGWGGHMSLCDPVATCTRGTLDIRIGFHPQTTGIPMVNVDEHLMAAGISAGISAGPQTIHVSFSRQVIRRVDGRLAIVQQRVSCRDRVFLGRQTNVWLLWVVQP
jgi:hypothetical protein